MSPEITVVIPVYNEGEAIHPCLDRVLAAVTSPCEVLVVYDRPDDYPYGFIARMVEVASGGTTTPTSMVLTGELAGIRRVLAKARRIRLDRKPGDAPQVVESWL